jgi:hypothetical protein
MSTRESYVRRFALDSFLSADLVEALRPVHREPGDHTGWGPDP